MDHWIPLRCALAKSHIPTEDGAVQSGFDACLLATGKGMEPLFAVYRKTCLEPVRAALAAGERRIISFHGLPTASGRPLRIGTLDERDLPGALVSRGVAANVNTPADLSAEHASWSAP